MYKGYALRLPEEEYEQLQVLAKAEQRSINGYVRSLIRREVDKSVVEITPRRKTKKAAEATA